MLAEHVALKQRFHYPHPQTIHQSPALAIQTVKSPPHSSKPAQWPFRVIWFGRSTGGSVYITIDDGWFPSNRVLALMHREHLPITAFLIRDAVAEHMAYWRSFLAAGGVIEDHTVSHPDLGQVSYSTAYYQWHDALLAYQDWFHGRPIVGRPPYGAIDAQVIAAAKQAGLESLVMWSAVMSPKGLATWNGRPLAAGEIIPMHWDPGLYSELLQLLAVIRERHLAVAPLLSGIAP